MSPLASVCVFCGSSPGRRPAYAAAADALGTALAERNIELVYGGGRVGLMGVLADAVLAGGGRVIGVIPEAILALEVGHLEVTRLEVVATMHERKARMADLADGFVALPGGLGTLDELFEILTWAQLGLHAKPCGLLDVDGYFDPLRAVLDGAVAEGFLDATRRTAILEGTDSGALLDAMSVAASASTSTSTSTSGAGRIEPSDR